MRVFAALPLPPGTSAALAAALEPVRARHGDIRWVNPSGFHLTLHFFGEVGAGQLADLERALADPRLKRHSIAARLGGMGQFPPHGSPRVVWVAISQGGEEARALWEAFEQVIAPLGWERDPRGFTPHVTVGRAGRGGAGPIESVMPSIPEAAFAFDAIVLFESVLGKDGAAYRPQTRIPLGQGSA
jgi:2'-5' RNA ligase